MTTTAPTVRASQTTTAATTGGPSAMARTVITSIAVATVVTFLVIAGTLYLFYGEAPQALVVGTFVAFWAGPGSGVIAGLALYNLRVDRVAAMARVEVLNPSSPPA